MKVDVPQHLKMKLEPLEKRIGRCYELAFRWVLEHPTYSLVHGQYPSGDGHAWAEDDDGNVVDLTQPHIVRWRFLRNLGAETLAVYDMETAIRHAVETEHYGPWE